MSSAATVVLGGARLEALEALVEKLLPDASGIALPPTDAMALRLPVGVEAAPGKAIELTDPENTPLAVVDVAQVCADTAEGTWIAGAVERLRPFTHGPARHARLTGETDLSDGAVALFSIDVRPADIVRAVQSAEGRHLHLVASGSDDRAADARLVDSLEEAARLMPNARVHFVPMVDLGGGSVDIAPTLLTSCGAREILDLRRPAPTLSTGGVILFTGLSGAGKSTVARGVAERLAAIGVGGVVLLDGDHVRTELAGELGFSAADRDRNLQRQAWVAARVADAGGLAICAPIAPFAASRAAMRSRVEPAHPFLVVFVSTPLAVAEARDRKGLYEKARAGLITDFTGIDSPYEVPHDADLTIDTSVRSIAASVEGVVDLLEQTGLIRRR